MKVRLRIRRGLSLAAAMALAMGSAAAGEATLEVRSLELAGSRISFPAVSGMEDAALEKQVNEQIQADLRVTDFLQRMNALISDEKRSLSAEWDGILAGEILSGCLDAEGAAETLRNTQLWTWTNVDLRDGHEILFGELFSDEEAAREGIEGYLEEEAAPEMSAHLQNSEVTPLPEGFRIGETGVTLLYPGEQLNTLSGRSGEIRIGWNEIREWVDWSEDGIPARIGAGKMAAITEESGERIREMTEKGEIPEIPARLGDSAAELTEKYHLLTDPDEYAGGRMFALEGGAFREVWILSDAVSSTWEESRVQGIRMDRGCAWGLCIGETAQEEWRRILGEPEYTVEMDPDTAEAYRMEPGTSDYYEFGGNRLQLHCDGEGRLISLVLTE